MKKQLETKDGLKYYPADSYTWLCMTREEVLTMINDPMVVIEEIRGPVPGTKEWRRNKPDDHHGWIIEGRIEKNLSIVS